MQKDDADASPESDSALPPSLPGAVAQEEPEENQEPQAQDCESNGGGSPSNAMAGTSPAGETRGSFEEATTAPDAEGPAQHRMSQESGGKRSGSVGSGPQSQEEDSCSDRSESGSYDSDEESDMSSQWPPKPPLLRFRMRIQFSQRFKGGAGKDIIAGINKDISNKVEERTGAMSDMVVGWLNKVFAMAIETEYQFEVGFPVIVLSMLDAIYLKRVRWQEVDWRFQYKRAFQRNFDVLEKMWAEVNMEKAREFRVENTLLRLENMSQAPIKEKIEFVRMMKRWFDARIHHAEPYDALIRRSEIVELCRTKGHTVKFPPWIKFTEEKKAIEESSTGASEEKKRIQLGNALVALCRRRDFDDDMPRARALIDAGANVHQEDGCPEALFVCCCAGHEQTARLLIDRGANLAYRGRRGVSSAPETAFEYGESMGMRKMVVLLRAHAKQLGIQVCDDQKYAKMVDKPFAKMPEFRRLIWFLGSPEHQTM